MFPLLKHILQTTQVHLQIYPTQTKGLVRREIDVSDPNALWKTTWGRMLQDARMKDPYSWMARKFRRRFRVPYVLFLLIVKKCKDASIFGATKIPYEFRVMVALWILGRGSCADDVNEMSSIGESTCNFIFHQFCHGFVDTYYDDYVYFPEEEELEFVEKAYTKFGFPDTLFMWRQFLF